MSKDNKTARSQRALVLQGGGTLGAYEAGVLKVLCKKLMEEDKENGEQGRLLFDVVAGTSIGAMNGAILVSQFLKTQSWEKAAGKLERFWTNQLSAKNLDISELSKPWCDEWIKRNPTAASEEAARRYYSVKKLLKNEVRNNMYYRDQFIIDDRFFDHLYLDKGPNDDNPNCKDPNCKKPNFLNNDWFLHNTKPLQESIEKYAKFPIATMFLDKNNHKQQPRLLVFSVDVAEGVTVTFDSYPKADGSRKSEYGKYTKEDGYENVVNYKDGISIEHVMASGTLPEFYNYAEVPTHLTIEQKNQDSTTVPEKSNKNNYIRYFWDGGLLSNTPLRELLDAHREYWKDVENQDEIPELDIYVVNVHPSKIDNGKIPRDHDGVKDRQNDITYGDRTSHYDEKMAHLITDYADFVAQMKTLANEAIDKVKGDDNDENKKEKKKLQERFQKILETKTISKDRKDEARKYEDLIRDEFRLNIVMRIERTNYINSIHGKIGDLTLQTINKLIKEGECDAWFSLIQNDIDDMQLAADIQGSLTGKLNEAMKNLKNDYENNDSQTYHMLTEFINTAENKDKLKTHQSDKLIKSAQALMAILD
jgi:NTE family protein